MDKKMHEKGLPVRKAALGEAYVDDAMKNVDSFIQPFQHLLNDYCSCMIDIAMISTLNRPRDLRAHLRGALNNGVTRKEIREILMLVAVYDGTPAAVDSIRIARELFAELDNA